MKTFLIDFFWKTLCVPLAAACMLAVSCDRKPTYKIGVSQCSQDDWRQLMNDQMRREIMFHPEAELEIRSADDSSEKQIADIRYFIDNGFDLIIAAPNEADALNPIITEAYGSGIPVIVFDRNVNGHEYTAFQGADNAAIGRLAGIYAGRLLPRGGTVIELGGLPGSTPAAERGRGFREALDSIVPGIKIVASEAADWDYDNAVRIADSLLNVYPDVSLVYAHNDRMALAASDVAGRKGLDPFIIGIDAAPTIGMRAVKEGKIDATFVYPTEGMRIVNTAIAILEGEPYQKETLLPASPAVDKSNVDLLLLQNDLINTETAHLKLLKGEVDGYWNEHNSQTAFLYALLAILILVCILLFLLLRTFWSHKRHQAELLAKNRELEQQRDLEKELNRQLEEATQSKLSFYTNVSHDLRTPLTLIAEPVDQVARTASLTEQERTFMKIADKNIKILKRLINQILDFRKYENNKLDLFLEEAAPARLGHEWGEAFQVLANKKHIDFRIDMDLPEGFTMAMDVEKVERVVFNLLSNAFKFTPVKGTIVFSMRLAESGLEIMVSDTGRGIPAHSLKNIFTSFYQVDKVRPDGSGIGLTLAKAFVELHGGSITVESREEEGTEFTVTLPVRHTETLVTEATMARSRNDAREVVGLIGDDDDSLPEVREENDGKPLLLVIDDNPDVRKLVRELLKDDYQIITAAGGEEGIRLATRYVPDIVICDVMMPDIDGMQTCAAIKGETSTSHIPVLLLTACSLDEQRAEGYESGADGYMSKPFNSDVLRARVDSLLRNRRRIEEGIGAVIHPHRPDARKASTEGVHKDVENEFYSRFVGTVAEEMSNMNLSVDLLAEKMGMGRSQFYRKIKALTSLSPVELLRDMRLKKARELLLTTDRTVSEIAYEVGFSTPAYFTKCYREVYSETPTALRERIRHSR